MLITVGITSAFVAMTIAAIYLLARHRDRPTAAYGTSLVALILGITGLWHTFGYIDTDTNIVASGLTLGYMSFDDSSVEVAQTLDVSSRQGLPSVPAMIAQLENRLAFQPNDAKGWSLLAQSYAFIGNSSGIEHAVANAVRLGAQENILRSQISVVENERR